MPPIFLIHTLLNPKQVATAASYKSKAEFLVKLLLQQFTKLLVGFLGRTIFFGNICTVQRADKQWGF